MLTDAQKTAKLAWLRAQAALLEAGIDENEMTAGADKPAGGAAPDGGQAQAAKPDPATPPAPPVDLVAEAHAKVVADLRAKLAALDPMLTTLKDALEKSVAKVEQDVSHAGYAQSFLSHLHGIIPETTAWILGTL